MGKKKPKSEKLESSTETEVESTESTTVAFQEEGIPISSVEATPEPEPPKPAPPKKFTGPTIKFKESDLTAGGHVIINCTDDKTPLNKAQILKITSGETTYIYRRVL